MRLTTSAFRKVTGIAFFATAALAFAGYVLANSVGDQTPPYEDSLFNEIAWDCFLLSGALAVALGLLYIGSLVRDENRR